MKGDDRVIEALNKVLKAELTAINIYFVQAKLFKKWGYYKLAAKQYQESVEEMRHAEEAIDRILFLDGTPIAQSEPMHLGSDVKKLFDSDLELELRGVKIYNEAIELCLKVQDAGSRETLEHVLVQTEGHVEWLEAQLHLIDEIGLENYLADQIGESSD